MKKYIVAFICALFLCEHTNATVTNDSSWFDIQNETSPTVVEVEQMTNAKDITSQNKHLAYINFLEGLRYALQYKATLSKDEAAIQCLDKPLIDYYEAIFLKVKQGNISSNAKFTVEFWKLLNGCIK